MKENHFSLGVFILRVFLYSVFYFSWTLLIDNCKIKYRKTRKRWTYRYVYVRTYIYMCIRIYTMYIKNFYLSTILQ